MSFTPYCHATLLSLYYLVYTIDISIETECLLLSRDPDISLFFLLLTKLNRYILTIKTVNGWTKTLH